RGRLLGAGRRQLKPASPSRGGWDEAAGSSPRFRVVIRPNQRTTPGPVVPAFRLSVLPAGERRLLLGEERLGGAPVVGGLAALRLHLGFGLERGRQVRVCRGGEGAPDAGVGDGRAGRELRRQLR